MVAVSGGGGGTKQWAPARIAAADSLDKDSTHDGPVICGKVWAIIDSKPQS